MMSNNLSLETVQDLARLDPDYLDIVLQVVPKGATVQFGETGQGIKPNYQVCLKDGSKAAYHGSSKDHKTFDIAAFDSSRISRSFSRVELVEAIKMTA